MIKIAICDDEPVMCEQLKQMVSSKLEAWKEPFKITCRTSGAALLFSPPDYDIIFLDIQMPGLDGVLLAKRLRQQGFLGVLIFVTVLTECMLDAFEVEAMDYLCKPVEEDRLERALKRSLKRLDKKEEKSLFIQTMNWYKSVRISDIYYCEVINRKIYLHTRGGVIDYYGKIRDVEQQTAPYLIRCHRSFLVNPDYLKEYGNGEVILEDGCRVPVSKKYHSMFVEGMMEYMGQENREG